MGLRAELLEVGALIGPTCPYKCAHIYIYVYAKTSYLRAGFDVRVSSSVGVVFRSPQPNPKP